MLRLSSTRLSFKAEAVMIQERQLNYRRKLRLVVKKRHFLFHSLVDHNYKVGKSVLQFLKTIELKKRIAK